MTTAVATLILAATAILGCIGSVLLLAYRIGNLTGSTQASINHADTDRANIWQAIGVLTGRLNNHIERHGR